MADILPLRSPPEWSDYVSLAFGLKQACDDGSADAVAKWIEGLIAPLGEVQQPARQRIEKRWKARHEQTESCGLAEARQFVAKEHGFSDWALFASHVEAMGRVNSAESQYESAADAIVNGDLEKLREMLASNPGLVHARSGREHRSTLLHYVSANGVEDFRQKAPNNIVEIAKFLLTQGAEVNAVSGAYGGGSTTLGLAATSVHPQRAGVQIALLEALLNAGAALEQGMAPERTQSTVRNCLANGQPEAAAYLASRGARCCLSGAAGIGDLDLLKQLLEAGPQPTGRDWIDAMQYASWYGQADAVHLLLDFGADPNQLDDDGQTPLHCAAYGARLSVMQLLIERGVDVQVKDKTYGATALDVALWSWDRAKGDAREPFYRAVALLARAGLNLDPRQWQPEDASDLGMLQKIQADTRMTAALRGEDPTTA